MRVPFTLLTANSNAFKATCEVDHLAWELRKATAMRATFAALKQRVPLATGSVGAKGLEEHSTGQRGATASQAAPLDSVPPAEKAELLSMCKLGRMRCTMRGYVIIHRTPFHRTPFHRRHDRFIETVSSNAISSNAVRKQRSRCIASFQAFSSSRDSCSTNSSIVLASHNFRAHFASTGICHCHFHGDYLPSAML